MSESANAFKVLEAKPTAGYFSTLTDISKSSRFEDAFQTVIQKSRQGNPMKSPFQSESRRVRVDRPAHPGHDKNARASLIEISAVRGLRLRRPVK